MFRIVELIVFGFSGEATYTIGKNGVSYISSLSIGQGYYVRYDDDKTIYITGNFQFIATQEYYEPKDKQ